MPYRINQIITVLMTGLVLAGCGRNPGAQPRNYPIPGLDSLRASLARAEPKCMKITPAQLKEKPVVAGKENFVSSMGGIYQLSNYQISQVSDRVDHAAPSAILQISDFRQNHLSASGETSPRLSVEASCVDSKGVSQDLALDPVSEIDTAFGLAQTTQPFEVSIAEDSKLAAKTSETKAVKQVLPLNRVPESAILLGASFAQTFKTLKFSAELNEIGSLVIKGDFIGVDASLSRQVLSVEATYLRK